MKKKIMWGIILLLAAAAVLMFAIFPTVALASLSVWKIIVGIILIAWIVDRVVFGKTVAEHFDFILPIGIGLVVFEKEISILVGRGGDDLYKNWLIILAAVLLTIAVHVILPNKKNNKNSEENATFVDADHHSNRYSARTVYIDAAKSEPTSIDNSFGATDVFFQNIDATDVNVPIYLNVENKFGAIQFHIPVDWYIESSVDSSMGAIEFKNTVNDGKKLIVSGTSRFGAIEFKREG